MKISTTKLVNQKPNFSASAPATSTKQPSTPNDSVSFGMRRDTKRKLFTSGAVLAGAAAGGVALASYTGDFTGTAAKIAGGIGGVAVGTAAGGFVGMGIAGRADGFDGLAGAIGGAAIGGIVGAVAGAVVGSMLGVGAGNALAYAAGGLGGAMVGGFAAKGFFE
jgi:hypothetical protein